MNREYARYYEENQLKEIDSDGGLDAIKELYGKNKEFYWKASLIYSIRSPSSLDGVTGAFILVAP